MYAHHPLPVGSRSHHLLRSAKILPPEPRQGPVILQIGLPAQDSDLELDSGHHPELLPQCSIRSELEL